MPPIFHPDLADAGTQVLGAIDEATGRIERLYAELRGTSDIEARTRLTAGIENAEAAREELADELKKLQRASVAAFAKNPANGEYAYGTPQNPAAQPGTTRRTPAMPNVLRSGGDLQATALRALERETKAGTLSAPAAERLERVVRIEDQPAHARYLAAVSDPLYGQAWAAVMASPDRAAIELTTEERAALREGRMAHAGLDKMFALGSDPGGGGSGWPLPIQVDPSLIIFGDGAVDPLRQLATVHTLVSKEKIIVTVEEVVAGYGAEGTDATEVTPTPGPVTIKAERGTAFVRLTFELLDDFTSAARDIARLFADARRNVEAEKFALGSGTNEPFGLITSLTPTDVAPTAVADYTDAQAALAPRYQGNARWLMDLASRNAVDQLVAEADASAAKITDAAGNILHKPWHELSFAHGNIVYGDVRAGFHIGDRLGMSVEPTGVTFNKSTGLPDGNRGFLAIWRSGSVVAIPEALVLLGTGS